MTDLSPKQAKGGVFAPADVSLLKDALRTYIQVKSDTISTAEERQVVNLLHRLNRI